jgi:hypothetical protein
MGLLLIQALTLVAPFLQTPSGDPSPGGTFGIASSAEWSGDHPKLFPLLKEAGIRMVRSFPEWQEIQPARDAWQWQRADERVESAARNGIEIFGCLHYLAPWASSGGDSRTFPLKDIKDWAAYSEQVIARYRGKIRYWEVYNEFNGGFAPKGTPKDYAGLVAASYDAGKRVHPESRIGIGCADVDLSFLEEVIRQGASGKFDFVVVHPYALMSAAMAGREPVFLRLADTLRAMLKKTGQRDGIELIASEIGVQSTNDAAKETVQAEAVVKAYALCMAQGIGKVFWFEGRGPTYGKEGDFGLLRQDWSRRPSFEATRTMTSLFGPSSRRLGWWNPTGKSYGFLFSGSREPVLVLWASGDAGDALTFAGAVTLTTLGGQASSLPAGTALTVTRTPVFITGLPAAILETVTSHAAAPFPWLKDYSKAGSVTVQMGASNVEDGLVQLEQGDGRTETALVDGLYARRPLRNKGADYMYFDVDGSYAGVGDADLVITLVVRPVDPAQGAGFSLTYESTKGYRETADAWKATADPGWQTATFHLKDANFANNWGWNFRVRLSGWPGNVWVKEVTVKRIGGKR